MPPPPPHTNTQTQVACGADHTVLLAVDSRVYSWGRGTWGQTGHGTTDNTCRPNRVQALEGHAVVQVREEQSRWAQARCQQPCHVRLIRPGAVAVHDGSHREKVCYAGCIA